MLCPLAPWKLSPSGKLSKPPRFMEVPLRRQNYLNHGWLVISLVPSLSLSLLSDVVGEESYWMEVQSSNRALVLATNLHDSYSRALWTLYWEPGTTMQVEHSEPEMLWSLNILSSGMTFRMFQVLQSWSAFEHSVNNRAADLESLQCHQLVISSRL